MKIRLLPVLLLLSGVLLPLHAQVFNSNRQYYDFNWEPCEENLSSFYRIVTQRDTAWIIDDYYRFAGIQMRGFAKRRDGTGRFGTWKWYHPSGRKSKERSYVDDSLHGVETLWYDNGQVEEQGEYNKRKAVGVWKQWHPNGQLRDSTFYRDGKADGVSLEWHPNGQLSKSGGYDRGRPVGIYRKWYEDGTLEGESNDRTGRTATTWTWYDRSGRKTAVETYENGRLVNPIYYEPDGTTHSDTARATMYGDAIGADSVLAELVRSIKYPALDRNNSIEGKVLLKLQIKEDGSIGDIEIEVPGTRGMNDEAVRAIRALRRLHAPPRLHNKPWSYYTTLPIAFTLIE